MRAIVSLVVAVGVLSASATVAAAAPANGAAFARLAQGVDAVVAVKDAAAVVKKAKKSKAKTTGAPTSPPPPSSQSY